MGFFAELKKVLSSQKYRKNPEPENLSQEKLAALNVGAINSEQTCYYCDSLTTGEQKSEIQGNLANFYGINDHDSAIETLNWMLNRGHRVIFDAIKQVYSGTVKDMDYRNLDENEYESCEEYRSNLQDALPSLSSNEYYKDDSEIAGISIVAWDMGRLVMVTRSCYDCGYINKEEAWSYIENAYEACKQTYSNWNEFAKGYIFGRAMWSGASVSLMGIMSIAEGLLSDEESPWKTILLK